MSTMWHPSINCMVLKCQPRGNKVFAIWHQGVKYEAELATHVAVHYGSIQLYSLSKYGLD